MDRNGVCDALVQFSRELVRVSHVAAERGRRDRAKIQTQLAETWDRVRETQRQLALSDQLLWQIHNCYGVPPIRPAEGSGTAHPGCRRVDRQL